MGHQVMSWWRLHHSLLAEVKEGYLGVAIQGCDCKTLTRPPNSPFLPLFFSTKRGQPSQNVRRRRERSLPSHCPSLLHLPMVVAPRAIEPGPCAAVNRGFKEFPYPEEGLSFGIFPYKDCYKPACFEGRLPRNPQVPSPPATVLSPGY